MEEKNRQLQSSINKQLELEMKLLELAQQKKLEDKKAVLLEKRSATGQSHLKFDFKITFGLFNGLL